MINEAMEFRTLIKIKDCDTIDLFYFFLLTTCQKNTKFYRLDSHGGNLKILNCTRFCCTCIFKVLQIKIGKNEFI